MKNRDNNNNKMMVQFCCLFGSMFLFYACYSFTGSSLNPNVKTAQINTIRNNAPLKDLTLSNNFTNSLIDRFDQRTNLTMKNDKADISINGSINKYELSFANITSNATAAQNRLTIAVKINYQNNIEPSKSFDKDFEDFENFDANSSLTDVESSLVPIITEKLIDRIFNAIITDW
jgi:hypothetical protein